MRETSGGLRPRVALEVVQVLPHQELGAEALEVRGAHLRQGAIDLVLEDAERPSGTVRVSLAGAEESYSEGVIDHLRSVEGTKVAALSRELLGEGRVAFPSRKKVSLRATDAGVDVSIIARAGGGGGHRQAAGFATEMSEDELVAFLRKQVAEQL